LAWPPVSVKPSSVVALTAFKLTTWYAGWPPAPAVEASITVG
jgi:hypothetical protein